MPQGLGQRAAGQQPRPADRDALPPPVRHRVGAARPRDRDRHDRRPHRSRPRARTWQEHDERRHARCAAPWASPALGGATLDNEENYLIKKLFTAHGRDPDREPGAYLTQRHRPQSGGLVRSWRRHDLPAGPAELRLHRHPGLEHGRVPPGRVPVGDGGQGARREGHPHRPAVHPHVGGRRHARAAARRQRHRLPRRHRQLHPRATRSTSASTSSPTPTRPTILREDFQRHRGPRRRLLRLRPRDRHLRHDVLAVRGRRRRRRGRASRSRARRRRAQRRRAEESQSDARRPATSWAATARACEHAEVQRDETLQDPRCVFQVLKRHYARYTPEMVVADLRRPGRALPRGVRGGHRQQRPRAHDRVGLLGRAGRTTRSACSTSAARRSSSCCWATWAAPAAASWPCAGTPASRARPTSRRCSTCCPATCRCPRPASTTPSTTTSPPSPARPEGLLGRRATPTRSACSRPTGATPRPPRTTTASTTCPRLTGDHGTYQTVMDMLDDKVEGYFLLGQNPAVGSAHGKMQRLGMAHLKWLVVRDLNMIESATFWKDGPEIETGELRTEDIGTEVFFFPAASHVEKDGTFTQTQRMLQWHHKAVEPPGDCRSELHFFFHLGRKLRERLAGSTDERDRPLLDLTWDYPVDEHGEPSADAVLREINGRHLTGEKAGQPLSVLHRDEGRRQSTAGGCWIYTGVYADGVNQAGAAQARPRAVLGRARVGLGVAGEPPHPLQPRLGRPRRQAVERAQGLRLVGRGAAEVDRPRRRPTSSPTRPPSYRPEPGDTGGRRRLPATTRSSCRPTARAGCSRRPGCSTARCRRTTSRPESPVRNPLYRQQANPTREVFRRKDNLQNPSPPEPDVGRLPVRVHDLPAHRAPHRRRHEPLAALPVRAAAGVLLRGLARAGPRARARAPGLGDHRHGPHRHRGAGAGHRPDGAADASTAGSSTRSGLPYHWGVGSDALVVGRLGQRPVRGHARPERAHPGVEGRLVRHRSPDAARPARRCCASSRSTAAGPASPSRPATHARAPAEIAEDSVGQLSARTRTSPRTPAGRTRRPRKGFFTDTSICIGCKACEVACKEWNGVPDDGFNLLGSSYDNTGALGASHLAARRLHRAAASRWARSGLGRSATRRSARRPPTRSTRAADDALSGDRSAARHRHRRKVVARHAVDRRCPARPTPTAGAPTSAG